MMFIVFDTVELYQNRKENCAQRDFGAFYACNIVYAKTNHKFFALYTKVPFPLH